MSRASPDIGTSPGFLVGHATHPDWRAALALAGAQLKAGLAQRQAAAPQGGARWPAQAPMTLGFVYFTDHYARHGQALFDALHEQFPDQAWVGSVGVGVAAMGVEYIDEPALVLMLAPLPADSFEVFSGAHKLQRIGAFSALVHADGNTPDLSELIQEMSERTASGYLFGGLASSRGAVLQVADGVWQGGMSGVAFARSVPMLSRVTQGCQPLGPTRVVTECKDNVVSQLDGQPALDCLLQDLGVSDLSQPDQVLPRLRSTLVGLTDHDPGDTAADAGAATPFRPAFRPFGSIARMRHLIGLDPAQQAVAVADTLTVGTQLSFCQRNVAAARQDLVRVCSEIREELESAADAAGQGPARLLGALYVSCAARGGPHFGGPSAELKIVQHALGAGAGQDLPLVGFFAGGEIAGHHLYGYTGVLTVFIDRHLA